MQNTPVIILVAPQMGENIGAAARAMLNFGLKELRIVNPRDGWPNQKAIDMAKWAVEVVEKATVHDTLADAIGDCTRVFATTARLRDMVKPVQTPDEAMANILHHDQPTAIVFGGERSGLSNEDVTLCDHIITIPVAEDYTSLNLAQAVGIVSYEWQKQQNDGVVAETVAEKWASKEEMVGLFEHLETELDKVGFFRVEDKRPKMVQNIRNLFVRQTLTVQEVQTLRGVVRALAESTSLK